MDKKLRVALIGGGIAGLSLMTQLVKQAHLDVHLYEAAPVFSEIGAGISFGANAVKAIHLLGLGAEYESIADKVRAPYTDIWFQWRNGYNDELLSASIAPEVGQSSVHRADFLDTLIPLVPLENAHFNKRLVKVESINDEVHATFADGETIVCDYLIGCDGIRSVVRQHVLTSKGLAEVHPRFSGTWAYRGIIQYEDFKNVLATLGSDLEIADVPQMLLAHNQHILTFPIRQGKEINIVAFNSDRTNTVLPENTPWTYPVEKAQMMADFDHWSDSCKALLNLIEQPTIWALHEIAGLETYTNADKNVIIIGDAAHSMLPHQGAGAGQGLEDALLLANLFTNPALNKDNVHAISDIYENIRLERAVKVQFTSRESGEIYELYDARYPTFEEAGEHLIHRFDWLWQHDLQQDVDQGCALLQEALTTAVRSAS